MKKKTIKKFSNLEYMEVYDVPVKKTAHGEVYAIDMLELEKEVAKFILIEKIPIRGKELRFLRKALGLSMNDLAQLLEITATAIHKWEKNKENRLSKINETVIRAFFADHLGIPKTFKFSDLNQFSEMPKKITLKAS